MGSLCPCGQWIMVIVVQPPLLPLSGGDSHARERGHDHCNENLGCEEIIDQSEMGKKTESGNNPPQTSHLGSKALVSHFGPKEESIPHTSHPKMRFSVPQDFTKSQLTSRQALCSHSLVGRSETPEETGHHTYSLSLPSSKQCLCALGIKRCSSRASARKATF